MSDIIDQLWEAESERRNKRNKPKPIKALSHKDGHIIDESKSRYIIHTGKYCGLARDKKWQVWLKDVAPDLHEDLIQFLETSSSCKKNTQKMKDIQNKLKERELLKNLVYFLQDNYPHIITQVAE